MAALGMVYLAQFPPEQLREVAQAADEAGLDELWLCEDCFRQSGIASAAAALAWTRRLRVGIGLLPVPLRNVALTAMEAATLHRMFPHRVIVGVGHGVQDWMDQVGARTASPVTLLSEYLTALRSLLRGEKVTTDGQHTRLREVALDWPPDDQPRVFAGATGPRTLRLSGELADGTILTAGTSPDWVTDARKLIEAGRVASGQHPVVVYVYAATGPDADERLEAVRQHWGYDSLRDLTAAGDAQDIASAVNRWVAAGATSVVLQPTPDDPDPAGFARFIGSQVRPLVR